MLDGMQMESLTTERIIFCNLLDAFHGNDILKERSAYKWFTGHHSRKHGAKVTAALAALNYLESDQPISLGTPLFQIREKQGGLRIWVDDFKGNEYFRERARSTNPSVEMDARAHKANRR